MEFWGAGYSLQLFLGEMSLFKTGFRLIGSGVFWGGLLRPLLQFYFSLLLIGHFFLSLAYLHHHSTILLVLELREKCLERVSVI